MLSRLAEVVADATTALGAYAHARALEIGEGLFWTFCDDYREMVKERAYGQSEQTEDAAASRSAVVALRLALSTFLRLFAPVQPFATEEAWSWFNAGSVHRAAWPQVSELGELGDGRVLDAASAALTGIRGAKTSAKASQKTPVAHARVSGTAEQLDALRAVEDDLCAVGRIAHIEFVPGEQIDVTDIELAS
jgi:valyl-tRNA synthetase